MINARTINKILQLCIFLFFNSLILANNPVTLKLIPSNNGVYLAPKSQKIDVRIISVPGMVIPVQLSITTDDFQPIATFEQSIKLDEDSTTTSFSFMLRNPGFYRCTLSAPGALPVMQNIGFEPEYIISLPDAQPDFEEFWDQTRSDLAKISPNYIISEEKDKSGKQRKVYLVKMISYDNEPISGYLTVPVKKGKYPTIIHYMGYHNKPWYAKPEDNPGYVEFVLSVRGQSLQEPTNHYGEWIYYGLDSKEHYYYRGAYMDVIRAIDYVCTLPQVDQRYLFAEGGSQGGAFTYIACALDKRIKAACPWIPFMNDFPDYFRIEQWPGNLITKKQKELEISNTDLYKTLSYFDIKNFAREITCPIFMGWGLQDHVCPPHTNFAAYNLLKVPKKNLVYPNAGHIDLPHFQKEEMNFFTEYINTHR